jgi:hypothetical protein
MMATYPDRLAGMKRADFEGFEFRYATICEENRVGGPRPPLLVLSYFSHESRKLSTKRKKSPKPGSHVETCMLVYWCAQTHEKHDRCDTIWSIFVMHLRK